MVDEANSGANLFGHTLAKSAPILSKIKIKSPKASGLSQLARVPEEESMEPRQSERLKLQLSGDEDSIQKAMRRAKARNLELDPSKFVSNLSILSFSDEQVLAKVASIGISLGGNNTEIASSIQNIKNLELERLKK